MMKHNVFLTMALPFALASPLFFQDMNHIPENNVIDYGRLHPFRLLQIATDDPPREKLQYIDGLYKPIRITFVTQLLELRRGDSVEANQEIDYILEKALPQAASRWSKHLRVVPVQGSINIPSDVCYSAFSNLPRQVQSVNGTDLVVIVSGQSSLTNENGADVPVCGSQTLAIGSACHLDQYDRPIIGFLNFCLGINTTQTSESSIIVRKAFSEYFNMDFNLSPNLPDPIDVATHELAHVFAFSSWLFKFFRDSTGTPRTDRPFQLKTGICVDGSQMTGYFPSNDTLDLVTLDSISYYSVVTPRVRQVARNYLDCQTIEGARLENNGDCLGSHWHERYFYGEIMTPSFSVDAESFLTALTLSIMEDSGWYRVDYRLSQESPFALQSGCDFVNSTCIENDQVPSYALGRFCDSPIRFTNGQISQQSLGSAGCDPSHKFWSACDLWDTATLPSGFLTFSESTIHYFSDSNLLTSFALADSCPIPSLSLGLYCTRENENFTPFYRGEIIGTDSLCVDASYVSNGQSINRPACMRIRCDKNIKKAVIMGSGSAEVVCNYDGEVVSIAAASSVSFVCPRLAAACPELCSCPDACSGRGVCDFSKTTPECKCFESADNEGCSPYWDRNETALSESSRAFSNTIAALLAISISSFYLVV